MTDEAGDAPADPTDPTADGATAEQRDDAEDAAAESPELEALLEFLRDRRGFDFTGYKRPSLSRRLRRRMEDIGVPDYAAYLTLLESQPSEFAALFDTILINVTGFRRDPEVWDYVEAEVIPRIVARSDEQGTDIRLWSAGCASGEEAYTLAVLLADAVGEERFQSQVKIYATDADEQALGQADRHATRTRRSSKASVRSGRSASSSPATTATRSGPTCAGR